MKILLATLRPGMVVAGSAAEYPTFSACHVSKLLEGTLHLCGVETTVWERRRPRRAGTERTAVHSVRPQRRLAAILVGDVVGYSRLMGEDERGTLLRIKAIRREVVDPNVAEHDGRA